MTLGMDMGENEDVQLTEQNFRNVCRLCLHADEDFVNVFDRIDENSLKQPLAERVYDLYQIKLTKEDGLPTNICHRCLYNTEMFSAFRSSVHQCERKLQDFVLTLASTSRDVSRTGWHLDDILQDQHESSEFYQNDVVVIDPLKCYVSSDEERDDDEDDSIEMLQHASTGVPPFIPNARLIPPLPSSAASNRSPVKPVVKKMNFEDVRPLRNVCFCKYCEAPFVHRFDCDAHESTHDRLMPYACNFCTFRCDNQTSHIEHIRAYHDPERPFFCTRCNKHFGRRADLRKHGVSHTGIRPFSCPICGKAFSRKTNVTNHMKVHEGKSHANAEQLQRGYSQSPTKIPSQQPKVAFGPPAVGYQPSSIDNFQSAYQMYQLYQQQPTVQLQRIPEPENVVYSKCSVKSAPNTIPKLKLKLKLKKPAATAIHKFDCITCKKTFKTKRDLDRHSQIHNGMRFQCSVCQKGFTRRDKLVRHEKIHTNRRKTAALPESAFRMENLKRSHFQSEHKQSTTTEPIVDKQPYKVDPFRPQFYAEYDLSETNN